MAGNLILRGFSGLDRGGGGGSVLTSLPDGVTAAQATLTRLVMVRIHVGQPFDAPSEHGLLMACGRREVVTGAFSKMRIRAGGVVTNQPPPEKKP